MRLGACLAMAVCSLAVTAYAGELDVVIRVPATIALEASGEGVVGMEAVAWVILNRARDHGTTPEFEVLRPYQFSCWNKDAKTASWRTSRMSMPSWASELKNSSLVWQRIVNSPIQADITEGATHYHAATMKKYPYWADSMEKTVTIGRHVFYRKITNPVTCKVVDVLPIHTGMNRA